MDPAAREEEPRQPAARPGAGEGRPPAVRGAAVQRTAAAGKEAIEVVRCCSMRFVPRSCDAQSAAFKGCKGVVLARGEVALAQGQGVRDRRGVHQTEQSL